MTYMVHDKHGNVWPPCFKSELCDPDSPHSMISYAQRASERASVAASAARAQGKGWSNGTMQHLVKPLIPQPKEGRSGALKSLSPERAATGFQVRWSCHGCERVLTTTGGSRGKGAQKICADCVAARTAGKAAA